MRRDRRRPPRSPRSATGSGPACCGSASVGRRATPRFTPAVDGGSVFAAGADGVRDALRGGRPGKQIWQRHGSRASSRAAWAATASWSRSARSKAKSSRSTGTGKDAVARARVERGDRAARDRRRPGRLVRSADSRIFALAARDGQRRWVLPAPRCRRSRCATRPASSCAAAHVFAGFSGGKLIALDLDERQPRAGKAPWRSRRARPSSSGSPTWRACRWSASANVRGRLPGPRRVLRAPTASQLWSRDMSSSSGARRRRPLPLRDRRHGRGHGARRSTGAACGSQDKLAHRKLSAPLRWGRRSSASATSGLRARARARRRLLVGRVATDGSRGAYRAGPLPNGLLVQTRAERCTPSSRADAPRSGARIAVKPTVVLVGRPNVGKSTLFNRLTRSRDALVADIPGLTRDRHYGHGRLGDRPYLVVDTGGFEPVAKEGSARRDGAPDATRRSPKPTSSSSRRRPRGPHAAGQADRRAAARRRARRVFLVGRTRPKAWRARSSTAEFHELGLGEPQRDLRRAWRGRARARSTRCWRSFPEDAERADRRRSADAAAGRDRRPAQRRQVDAGEPLLGEERVIAFDQPGTTRDAIEVDVRARRPALHARSTPPACAQRGKVFEAVEKFSVVKTLQAIERANVAILVVDARHGHRRPGRAHRAATSWRRGRALVVAVEQVGRPRPVTQREHAKRDIERKLGFLDFARFHFISALARRTASAELLMASVDEAYAAAMAKLPTPKLTRRCTTRWRSSSRRRGPAWCGRSCATRTRADESADHRDPRHRARRRPGELRAVPRERVPQGVRARRDAVAHRVRAAQSFAGGKPVTCGNQPPTSRTRGIANRSAMSPSNNARHQVTGS